MRSKQQLIQDVLAAIDANREKIIDIGTTVWKNPEPGYKEFKTSELAAKTLTEIGLPPKRNLAITGMRADLNGVKPGPSLAICGEMDSLIIPTHPECDPATGAAHACGHNSHIASMLGAAIGLVQANAKNDISGKIAFIPCPAEECIEIEWRNKLIKEGKIKALGGKAALILDGVFDDIDMSIMNHLSGGGYGATDHNGFCMKVVTFHGKSAHAAGGPQHSINALSAANLALHALALLRETYSGDRFIRSHGILTHGGESVNIIPDSVTIEYQLRAEKLDKIRVLSDKFDQCMRGCAMAIGCTVDITTTAGYMPLDNDDELCNCFADAVPIADPAAARPICKNGFSMGSTDMGDLSVIMPAIHGYCPGAAGTGHGTDYRIVDPEHAYIVNSKILAIMAIDLLYGDAERGRKVAARKGTRLPIEKYREIMDSFTSFSTTREQA